MVIFLIESIIQSPLTLLDLQFTASDIIDHIDIDSMTLSSSLSLIKTILEIAITISLILIATIIVAKIADKMLRSHFLRIVGIQGEFSNTIHFLTIQSIIRRLVVASIYTIGILLMIVQIPQLQKIGVTMLAGAGVAGIAIGFAAKDSLANIISGIFIAIFQPFRVGDYVTFNQEYGHVEDLTLRHTVICTWDNRRLIVPNSIISNESIINWSISDPITTWPLDFGIGYSSDIDKARGIILEEARKHPVVIKNHEITVQLTELGDFAVNLRLLIDVPNRGVAFETGCEIREAVKKRFDREGIEIPYPYSNVVFHQAS